MSPQTQSPLRDRILLDHIESVIKKHPTLRPKLQAGLTYGRTLDFLNQSTGPTTSTSALCAGLSEDDVNRFASDPLHLDSKAHEYLRDALRDTLLSILDVWDPVDPDGPGIEDRNARIPHLSDEILSHKSKVDSLRDEIRASRDRIVQLVQETNEVHTQLQDGLLHAVKTLPDIMNAERSAQFDVLALTIETCLLKLSLLRAKTHTAIYNYTSPTDSQASTLQAMKIYHQRLRSKDKEQKTEEGLLDAQLKEYEDLMNLVDGNRQGGFSQVVDDMARVRKETDECKRDLRRLGWTGD